MATYTVYDFMGDVLYTGTDPNAANAAVARTEGMGWVETHHPEGIADTVGAAGTTDACGDEDDEGDDTWDDERDDATDDGACADDDSAADDDTLPVGFIVPIGDGSEDDEDVAPVAVPDGAMAHVPEAPAPAPAPAHAATPSVATVMQLSDEGATADMAQVRHAQLAADLEAALGLTMGPRSYGAGVVLGEVGVKRFHASYDAWAARPEFDVACADVAAKVVAENRKDHVVRPLDVTMAADGTITMGGAGLRMEEPGFKMLLAQVTRGTKLRWSRFFGGDDIGLVFPRAYQLMAVMPPDLRATVWNTMVKDASKTQRLMFRTRQPDGQAMRSLFAVASETYGAYDADKVLTLLGRVLRGSGARGSIVYDPRTTNLYANATWHADRVFDVASGDVMGLSLSFRSNDARGGSIVAHASAECGLGRLTFGTDLCRIRHVGTGIGSRAGHELHAAVGRARVAFDGFLSDWGHLSNGIAGVKLYGAGQASAAGLIDAMVDAGACKVPGMDEDEVKRLLHGALRRDPGETFTHVARALTRAGQTGGLDAEQQDAMERAAGAFVQTVARAVKGV